jgi:hypothetical protein
LGCAEATRAAFAFALAALAGCATVPPAPGPLPFPGVAPDHDLRADFRALACAKLAAGSPPCESRLRLEAGEGPPPMAPLRDAGAASRYRIGFVPGLLAECLSPLLRPFGDVEGVLKDRASSPSASTARRAMPGRGSSSPTPRASPTRSSTS